jgi:flagellar export protein FliJ
MSRTFRLAAVERLRTDALEAAARALGAANGAVRLAGEERDRLAAELYLDRTRPSMGSGEVQVNSVYRDRLRMDLLDAEIQVEQRTKEAAEAQRAWLAARAGLQAVEALHERHRQTLREADARAEQKELDDLASIKVTSDRTTSQRHDRGGER